MPYAEGTREELRISDKLEALYRLLKGISLDDLIDGMTNQEVVALQKFVWDKTVETGVRVRGKEFDRTEITQRMIPTPVYQRQQGCAERVYYCKGTLCIHSNPNCARKKIKDHVRVMMEVIQDWMKENTT